ncbi:hypothetical protein [Nostoc sp. JL33]|nr:hypothetical protein [Nostoc sp. JL33]MBN3870148.1 hypothetical protein [Nostoc sp. JL33]
MNGNTNMRTNQQVIEITGAPAQVWGNVLVPARGTEAPAFDRCGGEAVR